MYALFTGLNIYPYFLIAYPSTLAPLHIPRSVERDYKSVI